MTNGESKTHEKEPVVSKRPVEPPVEAVEEGKANSSTLRPTEKAQEESNAS